MINLKFVTSLLTLIALIYGTLEVKTFLSQNFIERDTKLKSTVNKFLNGELQ